MDIKSPNHIKSSLLGAAADKKMQDKLRTLYEEIDIPTLYQLSTLGT
jgi:hypothetical protein